ncbi:hypothetical protein [Rhodococcus spongiicola]|uniref:Integral membrane protein n=1 Tax=Rhodococcus spongiicola TaxID=2487352 RepID=A0A3S3A417_9NOCA|nr:hypothetical protein [Rhodococcus spongiicola]RVW01587.1 hypothetical protein EF834_14305 [Rhodococcus spongiicola]
MNPVLTIVVGVTVLTVVTIASGGVFLLRILTGRQGANELQKSFFRAGHAHAGVLVTLGVLLATLTAVVDANPGWAAAGAIAVLAAAIFIPAGFFLSVLGQNPAKPGPMFASIWIGAACLVAGLVISGITVINAGVAAL